jgi:hypothetical protein
VPGLGLEIRSADHHVPDDPCAASRVLRDKGQLREISIGPPDRRDQRRDLGIIERRELDPVDRGPVVWGLRSNPETDGDLRTPGRSTSRRCDRLAQ